MARTNKVGLDFFSLDVDFYQHDKIKLVEAEFGIKGGYVATRLLCKIYSEGYFYKWGTDECLLLSLEMGAVGVSKNNIDEIVSGLVRRCFFDKRCFDSFGILTSRRIQEHYLLATSRYKNVVLVEEYLLVEIPSERRNISIKKINADINPINANINSINADINPQKEKEREKKKETVKKQTKKVFSEFVAMAEEEYDKLVAAHGVDFTRRCVEVLHNYKGSSGKKYASDYLAILNWVVGRVQEEHAKKCLPLFPKAQQLPQNKHNPLGDYDGTPVRSAEELKQKTLIIGG